MNTITAIDKLGYYTVNSKKFYKKIEAILYAQDNKDADIVWNFNDNAFNNIKWTEEPQGTIDDLYLKRAKQIREEYDYLIVMASGGADSTNIIHTFLKNGIHIDEVFMGAPVSGLSNYNWNDKDYSNTNVISETKYAQLPLADEIKTNWPNVKVTIHDYFQDILNYKSEDWAQGSGYWIHPSISRYDFTNHKHIRDLADSGKRIAKIFGIDTPSLVKFPDGKIFNFVIDNVCQVGVSNELDNLLYPSIETVYFYLTPDMPEIIVKSSHIVARSLYNPANIVARQHMADLSKGNEWNTSEQRFTIHHRMNQRMLYPLLHGRNVFQATKAFKNFENLAFDDWFFKLHKNTRIEQMITSDINSYRNTINPKYMKDGEVIKFIKPFYIGHESKFINQNNKF